MYQQLITRFLDKVILRKFFFQDLLLLLLFQKQHKKQLYAIIFDPKLCSIVQKLYAHYMLVTNPEFTIFLHEIFLAMFLKKGLVVSAKINSFITIFFYFNLSHKLFKGICRKTMKNL